MPHDLSIPQEDFFINISNSFCDQGTLMTHKHIHQFAQPLYKHDLGVNWTTTFLWRLKDRLSLRFYRVQELARLKTNANKHLQSRPESCKRFADAIKVVKVLDSGLYTSCNVYEM